MIILEVNYTFSVLLFYKVIFCVCSYIIRSFKCWMGVPPVFCHFIEGRQHLYRCLPPWMMSCARMGYIGVCPYRKEFASKKQILSLKSWHSVRRAAYRKIAEWLPIHLKPVLYWSVKAIFPDKRARSNVCVCGGDGGMELIICVHSSMCFMEFPLIESSMYRF